MPLGQDASGDISTSTTTLDMSSSTDMSEASIHEFEDDEDSDLKIISEKLAAVEVQLQEATTSYESLKEANGAINVELTVGTLPMSSLQIVNKVAKISTISRCFSKMSTISFHFSKMSTISCHFSKMSTISCYFSKM